MRTQLAAMSFYIIGKRTDRKNATGSKIRFGWKGDVVTYKFCTKYRLYVKKNTNMFILILDIVTGKFNRVGKCY